MSFHSTLIADAVLPADLRTLLTLTGNGVHVGRRVQGVPRPGTTEVCVIRGEVESVSSGGLDQRRRAAYVLELRRHQGNPGGDKTGKTEQDALEAQMRTVVDAYDGSRRLAASLGQLVHWEATEGVVDQDPQSLAVLMGTVELVALLDAAA